MYCKRETCLRAPMEYYEDLIQKVKDLGNAIRECGDDAPPEMIGVQDRFIRMITGHMTDRQHAIERPLPREGIREYSLSDCPRNSNISFFSAPFLTSVEFILLIAETYSETLLMINPINYSCFYIIPCFLA